jgi:hypothetical protein
MAECTIRLVSNPRTGKRDIYIDYTGEPDALPHEHERDHRALAKSLLGDDIFEQDDIGQVAVRRGEPSAQDEASRRDGLAGQDPLAEGQKG